jgi:hypothetical protein
VLSAGAAPAVGAPLAGRQQRTECWIDEFSPCLQLLDDAICIDGIDRRIAVTVDHERRHRDRGLVRLTHESPRLIDSRGGWP